MTGNRGETTYEPNAYLMSGDIMVGPIGGFVPGFVPVGAGQMLLFLTRKWWHFVRSPSRWFRYRHVAVIGNFGSTVIQAMPKGCEEVPFDADRHFTRAHIYFRPHYAGVGPPEPYVSGVDVAIAARRYVGTPYGFLTYAYLAAGAFRMRLTEGWLRRKMSTIATMTCSQHVDQALADAGYHVFDDGRLPQDVVPAELPAALLHRPGWFLIPGHPVVGRWTHTSRSDLIERAFK